MEHKRKAIERVWVERRSHSVWLTDPKSAKYVEFVGKELFLEKLREVLHRHIGRSWDFLTDESVEEVIEKMSD